MGNFTRDILEAKSPQSDGDSIVSSMCPWAVPEQSAALLDTLKYTANQPDQGHKTLL